MVTYRQKSFEGRGWGKFPADFLSIEKFKAYFTADYYTFIFFTKELIKVPY